MKYLEARDRAGVFAGHAFERHILELREARPGAARWTSACPTGRRAWLPCLAPGWYATGRTPLRYGSARPTMVPCEAFAAADGHIMAAAGNDGLGRAFADAAGPWPPRDGSPLHHQPRPRSQPHRLIATLDTTLPEYPSAHQTSLLTAAGVPVAQINHVGGAPEHPQVRGRAMVEQVHHPEAGTLRRNLLLDLRAAKMAGCWLTSLRPRSHRAKAIAFESGIATVP